MHPGFMGYWHRRRAHGNGCGPAANCGPPGFGGHRHDHEHGWHAGHDDDGPHFGVRRPLRFLAHKLELDEGQVAKVATILDALKTERAQAAVDQRRRISALADALEGAEIDKAKLEKAGDEQVRTAERIRSAVTDALVQIHAILDAEQRSQLAYLLRTGVLTI